MHAIELTDDEPALVRTALQAFLDDFGSTERSPSGITRPVDSSSTRAPSEGRTGAAGFVRVPAGHRSCGRPPRTAGPRAPLFPSGPGARRRSPDPRPRAT